MLRYRFKWNSYYGFDLYYGKEGSLVLRLWVYKYVPDHSFVWVRTDVKREMVRRWERFNMDKPPQVYFDWVINDMIREYEDHKERDE